MPKRMLQGVVVGDACDKTRTVLVTRKFRHPFFGKVIQRKKKFYAHDENNQTKSGDVVMICESRPMSKTKRWTIVQQGVEQKNLQQQGLQQGENA